jgi:hypothetical protein
MPRHVSPDGKVTWTHVCYVIELDPVACAKQNSPCHGGSCGRTPVYVGQTAHTAKERFGQHKAGYKPSQSVRKHGLWLRPRLARGIGELATKTEALAAEATLADRLRQLGYCVYGGH